MDFCRRHDMCLMQCLRKCQRKVRSVGVAETRRTDVIRRSARLALLTFPTFSNSPTATLHVSDRHGSGQSARQVSRKEPGQSRSGGVLSYTPHPRSPLLGLTPSQKSKTTMTGTQYQKSKEDAASIMREKQKRGTHIGMGIFTRH